MNYDIDQLKHVKQKEAINAIYEDELLYIDPCHGIQLHNLFFLKSILIMFLSMKYLRDWALG